MAHKDDDSASNLWNRRSNNGKLNLSMTKSERSENELLPSARRLGTVGSSHGKSNPFNSLGSISTSSVASPTSAVPSSAFGLGTGAFASFGGGANKLTKTPTQTLESSNSDREEGEGNRLTQGKNMLAPRQSIMSPESGPGKDSASRWPLRHSWVMHYRPPTGKNSDYEKSIMPVCRIESAQAFWVVYSHLKRPSSLPIVSDYHFFKQGIRPVWEDEENKKGGKWIMRLKKGVADRYWEDILLAMVGDQFAEASEEVCGVVVSVRNGEDVFSIWTKNDGGRNIKIRETLKRVLALPPDTNLHFKSHDESITQRHAVDAARQEKAAHGEKRRSTLNADRDAYKKTDPDAA